MQEYIDLGWFTVPLKGELKRLEDGTKTIPVFKKDWRQIYSAKRNTKATPLGGVITGNGSGIIAIDCDNTAAWELFRALDPTYEFIFESTGKGYAAGTIIYKYTDRVAHTFNVRGEESKLNLDVYSNNGFIYLATEANKTKIPLAAPLPELKEAPPAVVVLLEQLYADQQKTKEDTRKSTNVMTASCLAPLVKQFVESKEFMPGLFKIITPRSFRDEPQYVKEGYLHPKNVPAGGGSEYLSKVSAILGADISIDEHLYLDAMHLINKLWDDPMDSTRLESTILDPMLNESALINGEPIWNYDEHWQKHRLVLRSKRQSALELGFDDKRNVYYCIDAASESYKAFGRDSELLSYLEAAAVKVPKRAEVKASLPMINVGAFPHKPFGFIETDDPTSRTFNTFVQTPELAILSDPEPYAKMYNMPVVTLQFLQSLIPDDEMRAYLLRFLKRKLLTFEYSPVILYFLGVHGSGKDTLVNLIERMIGHLPRPTTKEFLEIYNTWILDSYFVQLDEYGNQLTRHHDKEEALGKLKAITGKRAVQIRQMRTDGFEYNHNITFIITANRNPLMLEDGDRRIAFFSTPNVLVEQEWVTALGGTSEVYKALMKETTDFAYYLAKEVPIATSAEYMKPVDSKEKHRLIADSMFAAPKLCYAIKHYMQDYLVDLAEEYVHSDAKSAFRSGVVTEEVLLDLYEHMTDFSGDPRTLRRSIRDSGIRPIGGSAENKRYAVKQEIVS